MSYLQILTSGYMSVFELIKCQHDKYTEFENKAFTITRTPANHIHLNN